MLHHVQISSLFGRKLAAGAAEPQVIYYSRIPLAFLRQLDNSHTPSR